MCRRYCTAGRDKSRPTINCLTILHSALLIVNCLYILAGVDGNRTHRGSRQPTIGFEDRGQHQAANYSRTIHLLIITL